MDEYYETVLHEMVHADYLLAFSRPQVVEESEPEMALAG